MALAMALPFDRNLGLVIRNDGKSVVDRFDRWCIVTRLQYLFSLNEGLSLSGVYLSPTSRQTLDAPFPHVLLPKRKELAAIS